MTAERRYSIFVLAHDGFEMKTYKGSSLSPIRLVHNLDGTEGVFPFSSIINGKTIQSEVPTIDKVSIGCRKQGNTTTGCTNADIAEVLLYDTMLTAEDLDRIAGYLSRKYDLDWQFSTGPTILSVSPTNGPTTGGSYVTSSQPSDLPDDPFRSQSPAQPLGTRLRTSESHLHRRTRPS